MPLVVNCEEREMACDHDELDDELEANLRLSRCLSSPSIW